MNTYNIPRDVKGEGRILYIFSTKALIYTGIGAGIGGAIYFILSLIGLDIIGYVMIILGGFIGFAIGTFKVPNTNLLKITKMTGGEPIDDIIKRAIKFNKNKNKLYVYTEEKGGKPNE